MSPLRTAERKRKRGLIDRKLGLKQDALVALKLPSTGKETGYAFSLMRALKVMGVFCVLVFILEIWMVNRLSTDGQKIAEIKAAEARLELENQVLENTIAENSSITALEQKMAPLGFDTSKNFIYIKPLEVASAN